MFGWLAPQTLWKSVFGDKMMEKEGREHAKCLEMHIAAQMRELQDREERRIVENEAFQKRILVLETERDEGKKLVEMLVSRMNKRKRKLDRQKTALNDLEKRAKVAEEYIGQLSSRQAQEAEAWQAMERKYQDKIKELNGTLAMLLENVNTPAEKKAPEVIDGFFQETGSLEGDICRLKSLLSSKMKLYRSFVNEAADGMSSAQTESDCLSDSEGKESKPRSEDNKGKRRGRARSRDARQRVDLKAVEAMLQRADCPYKKKLDGTQNELREEKARVCVLEKKEKLLNKMLNTQVQCEITIWCCVVQVSELLLSVCSYEGCEDEQHSAAGLESFLTQP